MRHFAVVGSGPAGFYTAEALDKAYGESARIDILDRYPVPYGLIRFGVAPDHQSLKAVSKRYDKVAESSGVDFIGNVSVGRDVSVAELLNLYDAVILAVGSPYSRKLGIPGEDLPGVIGSAEFVGWYNGHPDYADLDPPLGGPHAAVIGNGNVALDCARILSKTRGEFEGSDIVNHAIDALDASAIRTVTILGRRGPHPRSRRRGGRSDRCPAGGRPCRLLRLRLFLLVKGKEEDHFFGLYLLGVPSYFPRMKKAPSFLDFAQAQDQLVSLCRVYHQ